MLRKARETKLKLIQESNKRLMNENIENLGIEGGESEVSPLESEIRRKVGLVLATWMSPDNPPFSKEFLYNPKYFDGLIRNIMDAVNNKGGIE